MRKMVVYLLVVAVCVVLTGCKSSLPEVTEPDIARETEALFVCAFEDLTWTRYSNNCFETLRFHSDGSFSYSCACGDPVNDADLCEGYRYQEESKTIFLDFEETTEDTVTQITVKSCDGKTLVLDFDGDLRTFRLSVECGNE